MGDILRITRVLNSCSFFSVSVTDVGGESGSFYPGFAAAPSSLHGGLGVGAGVGGHHHQGRSAAGNKAFYEQRKRATQLTRYVSMPVPMPMPRMLRCGRCHYFQALLTKYTEIPRRRLKLYLTGSREFLYSLSWVTGKRDLQAEIFASAHSRVGREEGQTKTRLS